MAFANANEWYDSYGEAVASDMRTIGDTKNEALNNARRSVIEQAVGVNVLSEAFVEDFALKSDFIATLSSGHIVEEQIVSWDVSISKGRDPVPPTVTYRVNIKAKVSIEAGKPDISFKISASLNRPVFKSGDDVVLSVRSTQDCYLTVFNISENGEAYLVLPNKYVPNRKVRKGEVFLYPSEELKARGINLKTGLLPGINKSTEYFRIIATKEPLEFTPAVFKEGVGLESYLLGSGSIGELLKELIAVPANMRTDAYIPYEVVK